MSRGDHVHSFVPSVLDRLIPIGSSLSPTSSRDGATAEELIEAVRRDLEALLNTRQTQGDLPKVYQELTHSVFTFGVPDVSILSTISTERANELGPIFSELIERFEPRLRNVQVLMSGKDELGREIRFHIEGRLHIEPFLELGFETVLELTTGRAVITPSGG